MPTNLAMNSVFKKVNSTTQGIEENRIWFYVVPFMHIVSQSTLQSNYLSTDSTMTLQENVAAIRHSAKAHTQLQALEFIKRTIGQQSGVYSFSPHEKDLSIVFIHKRGRQDSHVLPQYRLYYWGFIIDFGYKEVSFPFP